LSKQITRFFLHNNENPITGEEFSSFLNIFPQISDVLTLCGCDINSNMVEKLVERFIEAKHYVGSVNFNKRMTLLRHTLLSMTSMQCTVNVFGSSYSTCYSSGS